MIGRRTLRAAFVFSAVATLQAAYDSSPSVSATGVSADEVPVQLDKVVVYGREQNLVGMVDSAAVGFAGEAEIADRPFLRRGELLEVVPGLIITQHSGDGKANQYFLRGFNLDHGTDFATTVDGVPVNLPSNDP